MPQGRIGVVSKSPERWEIWIARKKADPLPYRDHIRVPIKLKIDNNCYEAGLRSKPNVHYVWICPDLMDSVGRKISLVEALKKSGFTQKEVVELQVDGHVITVAKISIRNIPDDEACLTPYSSLQSEQYPKSNIEQLWHSKDEEPWRQRLNRYWDFVKPDNLQIER